MKRSELFTTIIFENLIEQLEVNDLSDEEFHEFVNTFTKHWLQYLNENYDIRFPEFFGVK